MYPSLFLFSVKVRVLWKPCPSQPVQRIKEVLFKYLCQEVGFSLAFRFGIVFLFWFVVW